MLSRGCGGKVEEKGENKKNDQVKENQNLSR